MQLVDPDDPRPLVRQIVDRLKQLILDGRLRPGETLPSTRHLAASQSVGRNTVIAAYDQLASEGFVDSSARSASRVADLRRSGPAPQGMPTATAKAARGLSPLWSRRGALMASQPRQESIPGMVAFHPGTPDISRFPFNVWRRLLANRMNPSGEDLFGYHSMAGHNGLRHAIAAYLALSRNVHCKPSQIVVTTGAQAALDLICRLLLDPGDVALLEEPGYAGARASLLAAGASLVPLPVSPSGWDLDSVAGAPFRLAYVTPACQMPFGVTMRMEQRLRLLDLATERGAFVIEDDFDGEFRFSGQPIPSLQGQDHRGRVIYLGTFAKTLFPALRLGYLVLPDDLVPGIEDAIAQSGQYPPLMIQAALADFIEDGHFARHVRAMRRLYGRRREHFLLAASSRLGQWLQPVASDAGIQTLWTLHSPWRDHQLVESGRALGLNLSAFSRHFWHGHGLNGFILGYAALDEESCETALGRLKTLLETRPSSAFPITKAS